MKKNLLGYVLLGLTFVSFPIPDAAAPASQVIRPLGVFDAGLNLGWVNAGKANGLFQQNWQGHAVAARNSLISAFSPPLRLAWGGTVHDSENANTGIRGILQQYIGFPWFQLYDGAVGLAWCHVIAQKARCPGCLKNTLFNAGMAIIGAGRMLGNQAVVHIGTQMQNTSRNMPAQMTPQQMQGYINVVAGFITGIQRAL